MSLKEINTVFGENQTSWGECWPYLFWHPEHSEADSQLSTHSQQRSDHQSPETPVGLLISSSSTINGQPRIIRHGEKSNTKEKDKDKSKTDP